MESNNWQEKTFIFGFIAIESLLLVIGMTKPAFSSYLALSRYHKSGFKKIMLADKFKAIDRNSKREILLTKIERVTRKELNDFLVERNKIASIDSKEIRIRQISSTALWEVDSLITMLILGVILFRVNQQIKHKSQLNHESQEFQLSKPQPTENQLSK